MEELKIQVNEAGRKAIEELCDAALRVGGLKNFNRIGQILDGIEMIPIEEKVEDTSKE